MMQFHLMVLVSKIHVLRVAVKPSVHFAGCLINQHKLFVNHNRLFYLRGRRVAEKLQKDGGTIFSTGLD